MAAESETLYFCAGLVTKKRVTHEILMRAKSMPKPIASCARDPQLTARLYSVMARVIFLKWVRKYSMEVQ